jgi:hypothetical protein
MESTTSSLLQANRSAILRIAEQHGTWNLRVFGSVARGDDEKSDIDLLVEFAPHVSLLDHAALIEDLQSVLGRKVDVASEHGLRPRMRDRVLK